MIIKKFLFIFSFFLLFSVNAREKSIEPLTDVQITKLLAGKPVDKQMAFYDSIGNTLRIEGADLEKALGYMNKSVHLGEQLPYSEALAHAFFIRAKCYREMLKYKKALKDLDSSLIIYTRLNNEVWMGTVYADFGTIYFKKAEYDKALNSYLKGLNFGEKSGNIDVINICLNNVGNIYFYNKDYERAIKYYLRSYEVNKAANNIERSASILDNISMVYTIKGEYDMALMYASTAAKTVEKMGEMNKPDNKRLLGEIYMNLGNILNSMEKTDSALDYFKRAHKLSLETHSDFFIAGSLINMGEIYCKQKKYSEAIKVLNEALEIGRSTDTKMNIQGAALNLSDVYEAMNQKDKALEYYKLYSQTKDSIMNQESNSQINELSSKYESDKREQDIELLTKEKDLNDVKLKQKTTLNMFLFIGFGLIIILLLLVFYRYQEKRKANKLLADKNIAISEQKELVIEKNKEITDSINYARKIQDAMLPSQKILDEYFRDNFIFYQPKDIISGDFYWALRKDDKLYVAAADCTGHGVPGALMSMIGVTFLRQIINEMNVSDTSEILNRLHVMVLNTLNEDISTRNSKDGMDVALLKIDLLNKKAQFSGAVRPLYVSSKNGFEIIKGDRYSIGGIKSMEETFSTVEIDLVGGKSFYMFSDGYADQFGQKSGKKFMVKNLQSLLAEVCSLPMEEQLHRISNEFNDWKGSVEQTDDVLLLGIKV